MRLSSRPAKRGGGTARSAVGGASASRPASAPQAPSTTLRVVPLPRSVSLRGGGYSLVIARSKATKQSSFPRKRTGLLRYARNDEQASRRYASSPPASPPSPSSLPGLTRWSMLTGHEANSAANLSEPKPRMDCRVKPGNDDVGDNTPTASLRGATRRGNPASRASPPDCFAAARNDDVKNRSRGAIAPELCQPPPRHGKIRPHHA
jgi:hypothetical protein